MNEDKFNQYGTWTLYVIYSQDDLPPYKVNGKMFTGTNQEMLDKMQEIAESGVAFERFDLCED